MTTENEKKHNTKLDLVWILPWLVGEITIYAVFPILLLQRFVNIEPFTVNWIIIISVVMLLLKNYELNAVDELRKVK